MERKRVLRILKKGFIMSEQQLTTTNQQQEVVVHGAFANINSFENAQRMATALSKSDLVPANYKNNTANCLVALEISQRTGSSIMAVMQNLHIIHGRPSWSSKYTIAALNGCGRFTPLKFEVKKLGKKKIAYSYWTGQSPNRVKKDATIEIDDQSCVAYATDKSTGERVDGPEVTIEMAVKEGWYTKSDSKWQTMPDLMIRYRAGKFFGDLYAPDVTMGMQTDDELRDVTPSDDDSATPQTPTQTAANAINKKIKPAKKTPPPVIDVTPVSLDAAEAPINSEAQEQQAAPEPEGEFF